MELRVYLRELWRYLFFVIGVVLLVGVVAFFVSNNTEKTYTAESRLVVTAGLATDGTGTDTAVCRGGPDLRGARHDEAGCSPRM